MDTPADQPAPTPDPMQQPAANASQQPAPEQALAPPPAPLPPPPLAPLPLLVTSARTVFAGTLWGGILLIILAFWLSMKFAGERAPIVPILIGVAGVAGLGLAFWHAYMLWLQKLPADFQAVALTAQRRNTTLALLGGGALLLVLALVLGFVQGPTGATTASAALKANFGESVGLFLFALVTIAFGYSMLSPPVDESMTVDLEPVRGSLPLIKVALLMGGLVCLGVFVILAFIQKVGFDYFPELAGLLLMSMVTLALGLWLTTVNDPDAYTTRIFVLIFGGLTGLVVLVISFGRAIAWRSQIFGGVPAWQGEDAWKLWLCVYMQLVALSMMYGSLLMARADIRSSAVLRRVLFGYKTVVDGLLLTEMLVIANIVFYAMVPYTFDWSQARGIYSIARSTKNVLRELKTNTNVYVLMSPGFPAYAEVRALLENMSAESNKFIVEYVSPDRDMKKFMELAENFPELLPQKQLLGKSDTTGRGILIVYGDLPGDKKQKSLYEFIPERRIFDDTPDFKAKSQTRTFKGEPEVMKALSYLVRGKEKRKIYFLQGDGEIDITMPDARRRGNSINDLRFEMSLLGATMLVDRLKKDNYEVQAMTFSKDYFEERKKEKESIVFVGQSGTDKKVTIPDDAFALVIAGASNTIPTEGLTAIEKYVDKGGRLLVTFDVVLNSDVKAMQESGMEGLVHKYGIESVDEFVWSVPITQFTDPFKAIVRPPDTTENRLAKQFWSEEFVFPTSRVVRPATPGRYKAELLLETKYDPQFPFRAIAEKQIAALRNPLAFLRELEKEDLPGLKDRIKKPVPVAVGIVEGDKPRMVVIGDTEFLSNFYMQADRRDNNYAFFVSSLEWLAGAGEADVIGPLPKTSTAFNLSSKIAAIGPDGQASVDSRVHLVPMWLMVLSVIGLGTGIWLVRRR